MRVTLRLEHTKRDPPGYRSKKTTTERFAAEAHGNLRSAHPLTVSSRQPDRHTENDDAHAVIEQALTRKNGLYRSWQAETFQHPHD
ncbi:hypothetical protein GLUCOINTEAF2_0204245 [Komagataeibacter intermedius AF2]|uniref:Uncharacterized protein n=1 Tax=Komagataeibacter intermedius AF2 TaxID=1458464 RepID=A0A0N1FL16_9PROT|nr:hypothetical protein GLUCOINTEAF2_0204245 [Komagataeibacter intermedius AF2]